MRRVHQYTMRRMRRGESVQGRGSTTTRGMRGRVPNAAQGGHLDMLKWAREHDCPWDKDSCEAASLNHHPETLAWVQQQPDINSSSSSQ